MKRSERLEMLASVAGERLLREIYGEGILRPGETTEILVSVSVKIDAIPVSVIVNDCDAEALCACKTLTMSLAELELPIRAKKCFAREGITTVGDLIQKTGEELLEMRNFGHAVLFEVKHKLAGIGFKLKGD